VNNACRSLYTTGVRRITHRASTMLCAPNSAGVTSTICICGCVALDEIFLPKYIHTNSWNIAFFGRREAEGQTNVNCRLTPRLSSRQTNVFASGCHVRNHTGMKILACSRTRRIQESKYNSRVSRIFDSREWQCAQIDRINDHLIRAETWARVQVNRSLSGAFALVYVCIR